MKNLNEYKAEILRRSEEKIEKKKRRQKRILSVCVPLCLILVFSSVLVLPGLIEEDRSYIKDKLYSDADGATIVETQEQSYIYAEVEGDPDKIDDPEKLKKLSELIELAYAESYITESADGLADDGEEVIEKEMQDCSNESVSEDKAESYVLTFTAPDGYVKTFIIEDGSIWDPELEIKLTLNEEHFKELKELLGITDGGV